MKFKMIQDKLGNNNYLEFPINLEKDLLQILVNMFSNESGLHYCWSNMKDLSKLKLKVKPDVRFYKYWQNEITNKKKLVFLAIDACCLDGTEKLILIQMENLLKLLEEFYWELDEIYIIDLNLNWIISVNHLFEFSIVGKRAIRVFEEKFLEYNNLVINKQTRIN